MAEDTLRKRLEWSLELDLDDVHKEIRALPAEFGKITSEMGNLAKSFDKGFSQITSEIKSLGQDLRSLLVPALAEIGKSARQGVGEAVKVTQQFRAEAKAVASEVSAMGKAADGAFKEVVKDVNDLTRAIRQVDMSPWEKQADKYNERINVSQKRLAELYYILQKSNLTLAQKEAVESKIAATQDQILKLSQAQVKAQNLALEASLKQKQAEQDKALLIAQTEKTRADAAAKAKADREAAIQQLKQERALLAEQKTMSRNAAGQNKGVDKFDGGIKNQIAGINTIIRQSGMSEWEKLADNYAQSISKAHVQVRALKASLDSVTVTEKDRIAIHQRIAESEKQIGVLTAQSARHVDQVRKAELERAQASKKNSTDLQGAVRDLSLGSGVIGGLLTAGIGAAVKEFGNFEEQIIRFNAVSESTPEQIEAIKKQAIDLGASTKYTAQEIAAAQVELAKMGFSAGQTVDAMEAMVNAAIASGDPLSQVSATIATTIRMFNMQASEAGKVADIITRGANISAQSFNSYADSMRYVGAVANALNQPLETVAASLNILADRGIKGTQAGEHLKIALLRLATEPKPAAKAMEALGLSMFDAEGKAKNFLDMIKEIKQAFADKKLTPQDQIKNIKAIFGAEAVASIQTFLSMSNKAIDEAIQKQNQYADSTKKTADKMKEGFNYAIEEMKGALNSLQIQVGEDFAPIIKAAAGAIKEFTEFISELPDWLRITGEVAVGTAALVFTAFAGAGGVYFVVTKGAEAFTAMGLASTGMGTAVSAMWGVISPILSAIALAVAEVGAVAYACYLSYKTNFGGMRDIVDNFMNFLFNTTDGPVDAWVKKWNETWANVGQTFQGLWMGMGDSLLSFLGLFDEATTALFKMIGHLSDVVAAAMTHDVVQMRDSALSAAREAKNIMDSLFSVTDLDAIDRWREKARAKFFAGNPKKAPEKPKDADKPKATTGGGGRTDEDDKAGKKRLDILDKELEKELRNNKVRQDNRDKEIAHLEKLGLSGGSGKGEVINLNALAPGVMTSPYSPARINPVTGKLQPHQGNDYGAYMGQPIKSQTDGIVAFSDSYGGYGNTVIVDAGNGNYILYAHNSKLTKKVGDKVKKGEQIALAGSTGNSTGPHSHQEIRTGKSGLRGNAATNTVPVNPNVGIHKTGDHNHEGYSKDEADQERKKANQERLLADLTALRNYSSKLNKELSAAADAEAKSEVQAKIDQNKAAISAKLKEIEEQGLSIAQLEKEFREKLKKERQDEFEKAYKEAGERYAETEKQAKDHLGNLADIGKQIEAYKTKAADPEFGSEAERPNIPELTDGYTYKKFVEEADKGVSVLRTGLEKLREEEAALTKQLRGENVNYKPIEDQYMAVRKQIQKGQAELDKAEKDLAAVKEQRVEKINELNKDASDKAKKALDEIAKSAEKGSKELQFLQNMLGKGAVKGSELAAALGLSADEMKNLNINPELSLSFDEIKEKVHLTGDELAKLRGKLATNEITQYLASEMEKGAQKLELFNNLLGDDEALRSLQHDLDSGKKSLAAFSKEMWLSEDQVKQLQKALEDIQIQDFADTISGAAQVISELGGLISMVGGEAAESLSTVIDGLAGIGQGIATMATNLSNPVGLILGAFQTISAGVGAFMDLVNKAATANANYYHSLVRLGVIKQESQSEKDQRNLDIAIESGQSPSQISALRKKAILSKENSDIANLTAEFRQDQGWYGEIPLNLGVPDFDKLIAQQQEFYNAETSKPGGGNKQNLAVFASRIDAMTNYARRLREIQDQSVQDVKNSDAEITSALEDMIQKRVEYFKNISKEEGLTSQTNSLMDLFVPKDSKIREEALLGIEAIAKEMDAVFEDVVQNFNNGVLDREAMDEYDRRMSTLWPKMRDRITKIVADAQEKLLDAADKQLAENADKLKSTLKDIYDAQQEATQKNIDAEQRKIDKIERQNEKLRDQIKLKNELLEKDKADFEKRDTGLFAEMVGKVNYDAELRAGLDAIHNPEGVPNQTYSDTSHLEAAKERIALLKLEAENKYNLEKFDVTDPIKNRKAYQQERLKISAIEARFAEEELKTAEAGSREYLELQQIQASAYQEFKQVQMEMLDEYTAHETEKIEESIANNNKQADNHRKNIDGYKLQMEKATTQLNKDIKSVDNAVKELSLRNKTAANEFVVTAKDLAEGIAKPLSQMKSMYREVRREIEGMLNAASTSIGGSTTIAGSYNPFFEKLKALDFSNIPGFSQGGVIPPGYPNDTFLARLSSGEEVLTPEQRIAERNAAWQRFISPSVSSSMVNNTNHGPVTIQIYDTGNPQQMVRIVADALQRAGVSDQASINGAYLGSLN